ncbi:hypothetical protein PHLCEN_2v898 [Hermanssonia centrifuga]|uniref:Uncharacterized protein n=1 Tax=Hermanssonia centrifuga TaxID=98765 RepID=A0A2R6S4P2_9APHY|nr:hypothetical protein PHLCEN_2v898 [Hermanssonia centrifuga]
MTPNYPDFTSYEFSRNSGMAEILFHTFMDYPLTTPFPGVIVPQRVYRSQQTFEMRPPIRFMGRNTPGILLRNALALDFSGLAQANTIPFITGTSARIALRIIEAGNLFCAVSFLSRGPTA